MDETAQPPKQSVSVECSVLLDCRDTVSEKSAPAGIASYVLLFLCAVLDNTELVRLRKFREGCELLMISTTALAEDFGPL